LRRINDVFGDEKTEPFKRFKNILGGTLSFESAVSQIGKGFGEEDFDPTLEEKAAILLYLIVKNYGFNGNKRIAAACFLLFFAA